jgi:hypothetical protein
VIGRDDRSLGHESVADVVDDHAEPFERANTQQDEIAGLSKTTSSAVSKPSDARIA